MPCVLLAKAHAQVPYTYLMCCPIYQISLTVDREAKAAFENWIGGGIVESILDCNGCFFTHCDFATREPSTDESASDGSGRYQLTFHCKNRDGLDNYLRNYAPTFRAQLTQQFGTNITVTRSVSSVVRTIHPSSKVRIVRLMEKMQCILWSIRQRPMYCIIYSFKNIDGSVAVQIANRTQRTEVVGNISSRVGCQRMSDLILKKLLMFFSTVVVVDFWLCCELWEVKLSKEHALITFTDLILCCFYLRIVACYNLFMTWTTAYSRFLVSCGCGVVVWYDMLWCIFRRWWHFVISLFVTPPHAFPMNRARGFSWFHCLYPHTRLPQWTEQVGFRDFIVCIPPPPTHTPSPMNRACGFITRCRGDNWSYASSDI